MAPFALAEMRKRPAAALIRDKKSRRTSSPPAKRQKVTTTSKKHVSVTKKPAGLEIVLTRQHKIVVPRVPRSVQRPPALAPARLPAELPAPVSPSEVQRHSRPADVFVKNSRMSATEPSQAKFEQAHFAEGNFRHVFKGVYIRGDRAGEQCVMKEFKSGCVYQDTFFADDIKAVKRAGELIAAFNALGVVSKKVYLNEPEVWTGVHGRISRQKILVEPFIKGEYFKFNSNTGYAEPDTDTMQALSHYSYHASKGECLLCDLQGGRSSGHYVLTDPVILSRRKEFGVTDLGEKAIDNFMAYHQCGRFCKPSWRMPQAERLVPIFEAVSGTTFGSGHEIFSNEMLQELQNKVKKCWTGFVPKREKGIEVYNGSGRRSIG